MCANSDPIRSRIASEYSRRRVLTAVGVVAGGGATLAVAPEDARADVAVEDFSVSDATFEAESVTPIVDAQIAYAYRADAVSELSIDLTVGETVVDSESLRTSRAELDETTQLSGEILAADAYSQSDFEPDAGGETTVTVEVGVRFRVLDADGNELAADSARDDATVEVVSPVGETHATIGGSATIERSQ
jgi:hypothetical protein